MLADLKVVETSNKDGGRTVVKIKGVNLIGKESWHICRWHVSEEAGSAVPEEAPFLLLESVFSDRSGREVRSGAWQPHEDTVPSKEGREELKEWF